MKIRIKMLHRNILLSLLIILLLMVYSKSTLAQSKPEATERYTFQDKYSGTIKYSFTYSSDSIKIKNGPITFASDFHNYVSNDTIFISDLNLIGNFRSGRKQGPWEFKKNIYSLNNIRVSNRPSITMQHQLNGHVSIFKFEYNNGARHNTWKHSKQPIVNGRFRPESLTSYISYINDTLAGDFKINFISTTHGPVAITGNTNREGYLNNKTIIQYTQDNVNLLEERKYKDGFLLSVLKIDLASNDTIENIYYSDVQSILDRIQRGSNIYKISESGFGIIFNNGYRSNDIKLTTQEIGNSLFTHGITYFDKFDEFMQDSIRKIHMPLTKMFQFLYPAYEDTLLQALKHKVESVSEETTELAERPNFMLRKHNSDSLAYKHAWLGHSLSKITKIKEVLNRIESGFFDYMQRDNYYESGIKGLNIADTVSYLYNSKMRFRAYDSPLLIDGPDSLLIMMDRYVDSLALRLAAITEYVDRTLVTFLNQEFIDSLDTEIAIYSKLLANAYPEADTYKKQPPRDIPYTYKVYLSVHERILDPLRDRYLNNSMVFSETTEAGAEIICLSKFLVENKSFIDQIATSPKNWNDSLFTIYQDNPFDRRPFESSILSGSQQAVNILLEYYANNLLTSRNCDELITELDKIKRLDQRVRYISSKHESRSIQLLDRSLRRERIPNRIERILEL